MVSGTQLVSLVSAWETSLMKTGTDFTEGGFLPKHFSPLDLFSETYQGVRVHEVTLTPGDCLYVPTYWWY